MKRKSPLFALTLAVFIVVACAPVPANTPTAPVAALKSTEEPKSAATSSAASAAALPDLKGRALRVGSDTTFPPFELTNDRGEIEGFDVDLIMEICKRINCRATFATTDFDSLIVAVNNRTYDMSVSAWVITEERAKAVDFGLPYMRSAEVLLVRNDETRIQGPEDLKNPAFIVAVQIGTSNEITAKKLVADPNKQMKTFPDYPTVVQAVINKQADVANIDVFALASLIDQSAGKIKLTGPIFGDEYLGMLFRKGDAELKAAFDAGLKAAFQDGTWRNLCEKWWKDITPKPDCSGQDLPLNK